MCDYQLKKVQTAGPVSNLTEPMSLLPTLTYVYPV